MTTLPQVLEDPCMMNKEKGTCRGFLKRFYFDKNSGKCQSFFYGGNYLLRLFSDCFYYSTQAKYYFYEAKIVLKMLQLKFRIRRHFGYNADSKTRRVIHFMLYKNSSTTRNGSNAAVDPLRVLAFLYNRVPT